MKIIVLSALILLCFALPLHALVQPPASVPEISLPDTDNNQHSLPEVIKGKVAMVVYWSLTCPHCQQMMPHFLFLNKRLTGNNFIMVFINSDGMSMAEAVANFAAAQKMPGPWLVDEGPDDSMPLAQALDIVATPGAFLYDTAGNLVLSQETYQENQVDIDLFMENIQKSF
ncbi:MAG: TlpA family protein disulfide reductase [Desulfarculales bacterium]|jgi:thiol-disulfide isomerase/thioredoxin|nr:TlpA family protein disulfide reductase [Desulfarculales bacterium]